MQPGQRRHLIVIQKKTITVDPEYGGTVTTWTDFCRAMAAVRMSRGRELIAAQAAQSEMKGTFNIAYRAGVTQDMRIIYAGKVHNITAVVDVNEQRMEMDIMVSAGLNEG